MQKRVFLFIVLFGVFQLSYGQQQEPEESYPFSFETSYVADTYANTAGGLQTGTGYMGMANLKTGFDTEKARWWKGGSFFINGAGIHGRSLSEDFAGDLQVASNIDAGNHMYLHELWFKQSFSNLSFTVGLQDLNAEFMAGDNAGEFINSSFGVPPVVSGNLPVPIFPLTGLGISAQWNINRQFTWQAAVFDGCQTPFEHNPYNLHWNFSEDDGVLMVTEVHARVNPRGKEGIYKLGAYYHSGVDNYGFYFLADQTVVEQENRKIALFTQVAVAPKSKNEHAYYLGLGANYYGIFSRQGKDILGLAVAYVDLHRTSHKHETAIECYYKWQFNDNFAVQPDVQYMINPSGTGASLDNALVGLLRLHINF